MQEKWTEEKQKLVKVHHASTPKISNKQPTELGGEIQFVHRNTFQCGNRLSEIAFRVRPQAPRRILETTYLWTSLSLSARLYRRIYISR
jgi:hypothetical protein